MTKTASKSVSKSASNNSSSGKNVAGGGQVYDRTTGTWEGSTKGSVGDGKNHHQGGETKVWRDANGIVGVERVGNQVLQKAQTGGSGSLRVSTPGKPAAGAGGRGAGSHMVSTGGGGSGPGSAVVTSGGHFGNKLKTKLQDDNTSLLVGGIYIEAPPGFSNADQWEELMGEPGDWIGGIVVGVGTAYHNAIHRPASFLADPKNGAFTTDSYAGKGSQYLEGVADWWAKADSPFGPDKPIWGFDKGGF